MRYIKTYENFGLFKKIGSFFTKKDPNAPKFPTDPKVIEEICKKYEFRNYNINPDGTVDVYGNVSFENWVADFDVLPLKFGTVSGGFRICRKSISDLDGFPKYIGDELNMWENPNLTSLKGCPEHVGNRFVLTGSPLITSLEGCPKSVGRHFYVSNLGITDLVGSPHTTYGDFGCSKNKNLASLEGAPDYVGGNFSFEDCDVRSFKHGPKVVEKTIHMVGNHKLYDPYGFRDLEIQGSIFTLFMGDPFEYKLRNEVSTEIEHIKSRRFNDNHRGDLQNAEPPPVNNIMKLFRNFEEFQMSLDYKYVEKRGDEWVIIEWKLGEALKEFDLPLELIDFLKQSKYPKGEKGYGFVKE